VNYPCSGSRGEASSRQHIKSFEGSIGNETGTTLLENQNYENTNNGTKTMDRVEKLEDSQSKKTTAS